MDYRLNRIDSEEKKRILSLHESATKKEYLSTGKKPLFEVDDMGTSGMNNNNTATGNPVPQQPQQTSNDVKIKNIAIAINNSTNLILGTDERKFVAAVKQISSKEELDQVEEILKQKYGIKGGIVQLVNDELEVNDALYARDIQAHLKTIGVNTDFVEDGRDMVANSFKIVDYKQDDQQQDDQQQDDKQQDDKQQDDINVDWAQQQQLKRQKLHDMTTEIQRLLKVKDDGKFGQNSINAAYAALSKK